MKGGRERRYEKFMDVKDVEMKSADLFCQGIE